MSGRAYFIYRRWQPPPIAACSRRCVCHRSRSSLAGCAGLGLPFGEAGADRTAQAESPASRSSPAPRSSTASTRPTGKPIRRDGCRRRRTAGEPSTRLEQSRHRLGRHDRRSPATATRTARSAGLRHHHQRRARRPPLPRRSLPAGPTAAGSSRRDRRRRAAVLSSRRRALELPDANPIFGRRRPHFRGSRDPCYVSDHARSLRGARRQPDGERGGDQVGLPQARQEAPSRPEQDRPEGQGALRRGERRLRDRRRQGRSAASSTAARSAPTASRASRASRGFGQGGGRARRAAAAAARDLPLVDGGGGRRRSVLGRRHPQRHPRRLRPRRRAAPARPAGRRAART